MAKLTLDSNYVHDTLIPNYAAVAFQTEDSGNAANLSNCVAHPWVRESELQPLYVDI